MQGAFAERRLSLPWFVLSLAVLIPFQTYLFATPAYAHCQANQDHRDSIIANDQGWYVTNPTSPNVPDQHTKGHWHPTVDHCYEHEIHQWFKWNSGQNQWVFVNSTRCTVFTYGDNADNSHEVVDGHECGPVRWTMPANIWWWGRHRDMAIANHKEPAWVQHDFDADWHQWAPSCWMWWTPRNSYDRWVEGC